MVVPRLEIAEVDLHHAHAALAQSARDQTAAPEIAIAVRARASSRLLGDVERLGRLRLHAESDLGRLNARFELRDRCPAALMMVAIQLRQAGRVLRAAVSRVSDLIANI